MKKEIEKVAVVKCNSYKQKEVDNSLDKIIKLLDFKFKRGAKVLIKPNLVTANVKNKTAAYTQPGIIEGVCKILRKNNCRIYIGESSFMDTDCFFKKSGIDKVAEKYNAELVVFEQDKLVKIKDCKAKILKKFPIAKTLKDVDLIINLPKLKTHILTMFTGGIKNLYGVIPGGLKQKLHNTAKSEQNFSNLLVDIYQNIKPGLNIMDGIVGMEGQGPTSGTPINSKLILGSRNTVALDIAASRIIGMEPKKILMIDYSVKRKLYSGYDFELVGLEKLPSIHFRKPRSDTNKTNLRRIFAQRLILCDENKCIQCGTCAKKCPGKAIHLNPYPIINKKKCIRCFCCIEICPTDALTLKE